MTSIWKLKKSKNQWKSQAIIRGKIARYEKKEKNRMKRERDRYKKEVQALELQLAEERQKKTPVVIEEKQDLVFLSLKLFLVARVSFRAVSRVLDVFADHLGLCKVPCPQTIVNWVTRLSIVRIQNASQLKGPVIHSAPFSNGLIWIFDITIGLGGGKILTILALRADHHVEHQKKAPTFQQLHCVAVSVASSWTGENVADFLQRVIAVTGRPAAFLKDGGTELSKATRLLEERGIPSLCIEDISHIVANLFKHAYENHPQFQTFISSCGQVSKKLKQTVLGFLAPPKVSIKARFMNLHRLVRWADQLLKHSPRGRASKGSRLEKLRASLEQLPECKAFIGCFLRDATVLLECQKILKNQGLKQQTAQECQKLVQAIPEQSSIRIGFLAWMQRQLEIANKLDLKEGGIVVSSDCIESLFGQAKHHGTGKIMDVNRISLRIPAFCGSVSKEEAGQVLQISVEKQQQVEETFLSLTAQRRLVLANPGSLEKTFPKQEDQNFELIPESKMGSKEKINSEISVNYEKSIDSQLVSEKQSNSLLEPHVFKEAG